MKNCSRRLENMTLYSNNSEFSNEFKILDPIADLDFQVDLR